MTDDLGDPNGSPYDPGYDPAHDVMDYKYHCIHAALGMLHRGDNHREVLTEIWEMAVCLGLAKGSADVARIYQGQQASRAPRTNRRHFGWRVHRRKQP